MTGLSKKAQKDYIIKNPSSPAYFKQSFPEFLKIVLTKGHKGVNHLFLQINFILMSFN